jgi:hypothetical protein
MDLRVKNAITLLTAICNEALDNTDQEIGNVRFYTIHKTLATAEFWLLTPTQKVEIWEHFAGTDWTGIEAPKQGDLNESALTNILNKKYEI